MGSLFKALCVTQALQHVLIYFHDLLPYDPSRLEHLELHEIDEALFPKIAAGFSKRILDAYQNVMKFEAKPPVDFRNKTQRMKPIKAFRILLDELSRALTEHQKDRQRKSAIPIGLARGRRRFPDSSKKVKMTLKDDHEVSRKRWPWC